MGNSAVGGSANCAPDYKFLVRIPPRPTKHFIEFVLSLTEKNNAMICSFAGLCKSLYQKIYLNDLYDTCRRRIHGASYKGYTNKSSCLQYPLQLMSSHLTDRGLASLLTPN